jgi:hypothetical protein
MKKAFKNPVLWLILAEVVIFGFLILRGFRITYNPELESSWSAISACAAWAGAIVSMAAIAVAIYIPKTVAEQQNKIALFEKRFEFYETVQKCVGFSILINNTLSCREAQYFFVSAFSGDPTSEIRGETLQEVARATTWKTMDVLERGKFLFDSGESEKIEKLRLALLRITTDRMDDARFIDNKAAYMAAIRDVKEKLMPKVEEMLRIDQ